MIVEFQCLCYYCGNEWVQQLIPHLDNSPSCNKCGESKDIRKKSIEKSDVFGYNSDKPKEDAYIKRK